MRTLGPAGSGVRRLFGTLGWAVVLLTGAAAAGALALALALSRSLVTILALAYVARPVSGWLVLATFATSAAVQLTVGAAVERRPRSAGP